LIKIAIGGKGGVGKTTLTALLAGLFSESSRVSVVDADPSLNLARALGIPTEQAARLIPLAEMKDLIQERVGSGGLFKLNPKVDDLADKISYTYNGIRLFVMGTIVRGGAGCACGENILLRTFLSHLLLEETEVVLVDMEAGLEHLGRRTIQSVDALLVVVEPGQRSIDVALRIKQLAGDIGLRRVLFVGNKLVSADDTQFIKRTLPPDEIIGLIPHSREILTADQKGISPYQGLSLALKQELLSITARLTRLKPQI
jgi:CO dehydrogenase maturation factor